MEGMPRVPMLTPDLKFCTVSLPADFATQIKEYILIHYQDDPTKYDSAIAEIENLRSKLGRLLPDLETLNILKRYYAQLCLMKNRFPMEEGDAIRIPFSWMDKGMDMPNAAVFEDINYELACVMYNIGAVHGAIAASELRTEPDSMKNAFTHFQCAAFPLQQIRDSMNALKYSPVDFDPSLLTFYINILLAQAQECLLEKGIVDHRKNTVIAKLAVHLRDIYRQCREHLDSSGLSDVISTSRYKEWLRTCNVKSEMYGAIAMFHLGCHAEEENKMGFRLAYCEFALEHVNAAIKLMEKDKRENLKEAVVFLNDIIVGKYTNAKKENEFIYHDRVPKRNELPLVEGVAMVKAVGFDPTDRTVAGPDLFAALLPANVLKSLSVYSEEKAIFKRAILEKVAEKDKELEDFIKSLQLEELNIDDESKIEELPEMLLERSAAFNSQPDAFPELLDKLHRVGGCAIEADHKISDLRNRLDAVNSVQLKSDEGFVAIQKELDRINDHHMKARTNNAELQRALAAHSENLKLLAMPLDGLSKRLMDTARTRPADSPEGQLLKKMLDKTNEMSTQRRSLLSKLSEELQNDDITAKCLAEKNEDNQELYAKELKKHEETAKLIDLNLAAQQNILNALTDANASFGDYRRKIIEENKNRMDQVLALTAAYDVYVDVSQKAEEGLKFYSTLFSLLRGLDEAVEAIESAFEDEKQEREKEMLRELEKRTANWKVGGGGTPTDRKADGSLSSEDATGVGPLEAGTQGLRLKDCLEYYRANIAASQMRSHSLANTPAVPSSTIPYSGTPQLPPRTVAYSSTPQLPPSTLPYSGTPQLHGYRSVPPQPHATAISNQPVPNAPLSSATAGVQQSYIPSGTIGPSQQSFVTSGKRPMVSGTGCSVPQQTVFPPSDADVPITRTEQPELPMNQFASGYHRKTSLLSASNAQQIATSAPSNFPAISGISQPLPATATTGSTLPPSVSIPQNTALGSGGFPITVPGAQPVQASYSTTSRVQQPATPFRSTPVTIQSSSGHAASPFAPIRMRSDFASDVMVPTSAIPSTVAKPTVLPAHVVSHPESSTYDQTAVSPWHRSLANVSQAPISDMGILYTSAAQPLPSAQSFFSSTVSEPPKSTVFAPLPDIMDAPLETTLPAPLAPTHAHVGIGENESNNSTVQQLVTVHSTSSNESTRTEDVPLTQTPKPSESMQQQQQLMGSPLSSVVVQSPRPAAAVAPIMQTDCNTNCTNDSTLCITNVTSMSYTAPPPQSNTKVSLGSPQPERSSNGTVEEGSSAVKDVMNPQTFTIGETDPIRLGKRHMRQQFRAEGTAAQLPPLDPADPINCIDAHYWLKKS